MDAFVNDIRLFYEQYGEGRPLVLLHGNGEDHTIFDEAMEVLGERFTCFAIDSRGHGDSDMVDELHYEDMAADLLAFLEALDLWDVVLCGYSDGGIVALMAAPWTDRVTDLIVCGANTRPRALKRRADIDHPSDALLRKAQKQRVPVRVKALVVIMCMGIENQRNLLTGSQNRPSRRTAACAADRTGKRCI